ncbi:hypothetical protein NSK_004824 [Nannochloropsis salina CCMP1776]|uniref:RRM domain-containing protein n=1 Tax=Nannochloropsis salina CCMP1776 TaxID=1027361 RepID=A0A4D9CWX7_9STRA|nr:hypothetical protein NSK_004824 [Nannochloropsis salina CCMP1776]|eukprot:TFJ83720.1 hypothetical protein NSK_004824 [Nannochloropsis salina CCMP1776]
MSRFDVDDDDHDLDESSGGLSSQLPTEPPFLAYITDTEASEDDIRAFFGAECEVVEVNVANNVAKVEFKERDTLARALFYSGRLLMRKEAKISLTLATASTPAPRPAQATAFKSTSSQYSSSSTAASVSSNTKNGGGSGRERGGGKGYQGQSRGSPSRDRGRGGPRGGEGGRRGPRPNIFGGENGPRRAALSSEGGGGGDGAREEPAKEEGGVVRPQRPRLQLKPRSKPLVDEEGERKGMDRKQSIFGGGRPHDEVAFEKQWQEKHKEDGRAEEALAGTGGKYSLRGDRTLKLAAGAGGEDGGGGFSGRGRGGHWGAGRREGPGGRGGGRGGGGRGGSASKKPSIKKNVTGPDEWQEVEASVVRRRGQGSLARGGEEGEEGITRAVGGAFAALNMEEDSD